MSLAALFEGDFDGYFAANRHRAGDFWFFLHVPKTAGSSFWKELSVASGVACNVGVDYRPGVSPREAREQALATLVRDAESCKATAGRGHIPRAELGPLYEAFSTVRLLTMLRDPVARVVSDFRYSRTPAHPGHEDVIRRFPTIHDYVERPEMQNKLYKFLQHSPAATPSEVCERVTAEFAFVGFTERYPLSRWVLMRLLGQRPGAMAEERRTSSLPHNRVDLDPELKRKIAKLNERDAELVTWFRDRLDRVRNDLWEWLKSQS